MLEMTKNSHALPWVAEHADLLEPNSEILDVACGSGRHSLYLHSQGHRITALDIDLSAMRQNEQSTDVILIEADIENNPWPLSDHQFDAVIITNYLWRPLFPIILKSVRAGGLLIYETFMQGNEEYGRPSNSNFLLKPNELQEITKKNFDMVDFFQGFTKLPKPALKQSIVARKRKTHSAATDI